MRSIVELVKTRTLVRGAYSHDRKYLSEEQTFPCVIDVYSYQKRNEIIEIMQQSGRKTYITKDLIHFTADDPKEAAEIVLKVLEIDREAIFEIRLFYFTRNFPSEEYNRAFDGFRLENLLINVDADDPARIFYVGNGVYYLYVWHEAVAQLKKFMTHYLLKGKRIDFFVIYVSNKDFYSYLTMWDEAFYEYIEKLSESDKSVVEKLAA